MPWGGFRLHRAITRCPFTSNLRACQPGRLVADSVGSALCGSVRGAAPLTSADTAGGSHARLCLPAETDVMTIGFQNEELSQAPRLGCWLLYDICAAAPVGVIQGINIATNVNPQLTGPGAPSLVLASWTQVNVDRLAIGAIATLDTPMSGRIAIKVELEAEYTNEVIGGSLDVSDGQRAAIRGAGVCLRDRLSSRIPPHWRFLALRTAQCLAANRGSGVKAICGQCPRHTTRWPADTLQAQHRRLSGRQRAARFRQPPSPGQRCKAPSLGTP